jgi:NhaP-type Na+/H+ or K+/H+ antiporter
MDRSRTHHFSGRRGRNIATLVLPLFVFGLADVLGANVFIAAFVAGLIFGAASVTLQEEEETSQLLEVAADLLGFVVWFFAGGIALVVFEDGIAWEYLLLALLVLTVLRIIPVFLSLIGTGFKWPTVAFLGWFGPRGLATVVFGLLALEELGPDSPVMDSLSAVIGLTVVISVFAHGISAAPLSSMYGAWVARTHPPIERKPSVEPAQGRGRAGH